MAARQPYPTSNHILKLRESRTVEQQKLHLQHFQVQLVSSNELSHSSIIRNAMPAPSNSQHLPDMTIFAGDTIMAVVVVVTGLSFDHTIT